MTTQDYIQENEQRKAKLFPAYDPLTGIGSTIPRFKLTITKNRILYLPEIGREYFTPEFIDDNTKWRKDNSFTVDEIETIVHLWRIKYDFEYWCFTCVKITNKEGAGLIPFKFRYAQRVLFAVLWSMFSNYKPILMLLLKARQFGGSTVIQIFMFWLQAFHFTNWNSLIFGNKESQARVIRGMVSRVMKNHPKDIKALEWSPFEGSSKTKILNEGDRDCVISIGSMNDPEGSRSEDIKMAHITELASMKETLGAKPEDLTQTVRATIPHIHGAMEVLESTAKGVGNFWHKEWLAAKKGETAYAPVFIPFFLIEMYFKEFDNDTERDLLIQSIANPESSKDFKSRKFWDLGSSLESINWYWWFKKNKRYSDWRMASEYPGDDIEAFQSAETRAFDPDYVQKARACTCDPIWIGDIKADADKGKGALTNIRLVENPQGPLKIWAKPDTETKCSNRYVIPIDIGGKGDKADWSVIRVLDRIDLVYGGVPVAVATYVNHLDHDLLAWKGAQIAYFWEKGLFVPESNTYDKENYTEGDHIVTVLDQVLPFYDNIFCRTDPEKIRQGFPVRYGFHTNKSTKPDLISTINAAFRDEGYLEMDAEVLDEADQYEIKDGNKFGNADGLHDDRLMATAIGLKVSELMPMPALIQPKPKTIIKKTGSVAEF